MGRGKDRTPRTRRRTDPAIRFMRYVRRGAPDECWEWGGGYSKGYGIFMWRKGYPRGAHCVAYELWVGPIPAGKQLDHLCRNPRCINPSHLEPVPQRINLLRGIGPAAVHARKTHCIHGHEFTPENTYLNYKGGRSCKTCNRLRYASRREVAVIVPVI